MNTHYKLAYINNTIQIIDKELKNTEKEIKNHHDPDTFGVIDKYEEIIGIGFTVCQTFLSSVCGGRNKRELLPLPPFHSSGMSYAQITNACANFWKHNEEWNKESIGKREKYTIEIFENLNIDVWESYLIFNSFYELLGPTGTFSKLLEYLSDWSSGEVLRSLTSTKSTGSF